jgi:hypothetical protein
VDKDGRDAEGRARDMEEGEYETNLIISPP